MNSAFSYIKWLDEVGLADFELVGGKAASQGELIAHKIPVPRGFCITVMGFKECLDFLGISGKISDIFAGKVKGQEELILYASEIRMAIQQGEMLRQLKDEIVSAINILNRKKPVLVVRSSATVEDATKTSFAGQFVSFLGIKTTNELISRVKDCWASVFADRVVFYSLKNGLPLNTVLMGVLVQEFVNASKAGVLFTAHPVTLDNKKCVIEANWGLGETVVSGQVLPDRYTVNKQTMSIESQQISEKDKMSVFQKTSKSIDYVDTPQDMRHRSCLDEEEVLKLVELGNQIENIFGEPQDIEWAIEGKRIFILQSRPITTKKGGGENKW